MRRLTQHLILVSLLASTGAGCDSDPVPVAIVPYALDEVDPQPVPQIGWAAVANLYDYPDFERRVPYGGSLRVAVTVDTSGRSQGVEVTQAVSPGLDAHGVQSIVKTVWRPGQRNGVPVPVRGEVCGEYEVEGAGTEAVGSVTFGWCGR